MYKIKHIYHTLFAALLLSLSFSSFAEQAKQFDNLEVHYIAIPSTFLQPDIAKYYEIKRSKYTGVINISVLDKNNKSAAVAGKISGSGRNLMGQIEQLTFKEIKEADAIYYIATYPFTNEEIVEFTIKVEAQDKTNTFTFPHKFYVN
ncbi:MAG: DUF4426 domain-containing protein [Psychromonas sp.]